MTTLHETRKILAKLVSFPTLSAEPNLNLIAWVENYLEPFNPYMQRIPSTCGNKANLWVRFGPEKQGGIVLSGHTDVVPVKGQNWHSNPFSLHQEQQRLYGRGTADMKSFIALALAFAPQWKNSPIPIHLALSYDEETGCLGAPDMIRTISSSRYPPDTVWVGEPTNWQIVNSHKGVCVHEVTVTGKEAHSSTPNDGVSAIHEALELMLMLRHIARKEENNPGLNPATTTTLTIGQLEGGQAPNIIAGSCRFVFDLRLPPGKQTQQVLAPFLLALKQAHNRIREQTPDGGIQIQRLCEAPPLAPQPQGTAQSLLHRLTGDNSAQNVAYAAEAGQFQQAGFSTAICGPGSIQQAHRPNEWIAISELQRGTELFGRLTTELQHT